MRLLCPKCGAPVVPSPCKLCGLDVDHTLSMWRSQTPPADGPYHPDCYYRKWPAQTGPTPNPWSVPERPLKNPNAIEIRYSESWGIVCNQLGDGWIRFPIGTADLQTNEGLGKLLAETIPNAEIECSEIRLFQPATPFEWHRRQSTAEETL